MSEVGKHPPFRGISRAGFVVAQYYNTFPPTTVPEPPWFDSGEFNTVQLSESFNMMMGIQPIGGGGIVPSSSVSGVYFQSFPPPGGGNPPYSPDYTYEITPETGWGSPPSYPSGGPYSLEEPYAGVPQVKESITAETWFYYTVAQDANKSQYHKGCGVKYKAKLATYIFNATFNKEQYLANWEWTASEPTSENVEITVTADEVDWSQHPDYIATIKSDQKYGPIKIFDAEFNYEVSTGWFDPPTLSWYGTTAQVTVKVILDIDADVTSYDYPWEVPLTQAYFRATEITPPQIAYR